jgi:hypothetical protein
LHVFVEAKSLLEVQALRVFGRVRGVVEFRGVLGNQHDRLRLHPAQRRCPMRLENLIGRDLGVVQELIGRVRFVPPITSSVNAQLRINRERCDQLLAAFVQSLIPQINPVQFLANRSLVPLRHPVAPGQIGRPNHAHHPAQILCQET